MFASCILDKKYFKLAIEYLNFWLWLTWYTYLYYSFTPHKLCNKTQRIKFKYIVFKGIHPHEAKSWEDNYFEELKDIAKNPECVAIGICGLDYNKDFSAPDVQRKVFELQVTLKNFIISLVFTVEI